ncbi:MAG: hypothetical protein CBC65_009750 [Rhodothermaceae bacterium TMED105]|nr:MAG: hypothetical protein CBC65_009750 [Rhodothermaceae bacterium TMED105]|tara:strand:+ start:5851 stop:7380 length:1530 start_codon:yes stop_codon:yes gene_type:complete
MKSLRKVVALLLLGVASHVLAVFAPCAFAQESTDPVLYTQQALEFTSASSGATRPGLTLPGTATAYDLGSILDNPASAALFREGFFDLSLAATNTNEEAIYLGGAQTDNQLEGSLSSLGFVVALPTRVGALNFGGSYVQTASFNRAYSVVGFNQDHTITDQFKIPGSTYNGIAFDTYAIDYGDVDQTYRESIFRIGFTPEQYPGIQQDAEVLQEGIAGEWNAFVATEFQRNLFVGASIGVTNGEKTYKRTFLELDLNNVYNGDFIDTNSDGEGETDVYNMLLDDDFRSEYSGLSARLGIIYQVGDMLRLGASYKLPSTLKVTERYDSVIRTTMDNAEYFQSSLSGDFEYKIKQPSTVSGGLSIGTTQGIEVAFGADYTPLSNTEVDYIDLEYTFDERIDNEYIESVYDDVLDLRAGLKYTAPIGVTVFGSALYQAPRFKGSSQERIAFGFGGDVPVNRNLSVFVNSRLTSFAETSTVYSYEDGFFQPAIATTDLDVLSFDLQVGIKARF